MNRISIITICFNDRVGLERTFASVQEQTFRGFDHIVVDGGSTDGSAEVVRSHAARLFRWVSEADGGIYDAQNKGWRMAVTPYVLFLNAGDRFAGPDVLERAVAMLPEDADIAYGDAALAKEGVVYAAKKHPPSITTPWLLTEVVAHQSQIIRRSLLERYNGYDTAWPIVADYAFFARAFWEGGCRIRKLDLVVGVFDTGGISSDPRRKTQVAAERRAVQRRYAPFVWYLLYHGYAHFNRLIGR